MISSLSLTQGLSFKLYLNLGIRLIFLEFPTKCICLFSPRYTLNSCTFVLTEARKLTSLIERETLKGTIMLYVGSPGPGGIAVGFWF